MHEYYAASRNKLRKGMDRFLSLATPELEKTSGKQYAEPLPYWPPVFSQDNPYK